MSGIPEVVSNGPNQRNHLETESQVWERPWTLDEMRQTSANWSLAADSGLFLFLQDFSHKMLSKTHEIEKQLDGLIRDTKATDSCLHSVFNDFLMLSNTQFIENRVYDEEVDEPAPKAEATEKQPEQDKTREQKEAELIPKIQEAVNYGLKVLDSAFEQLDIKAGNSDSDDEETTDRVEAILEPRDLYVDRPLPYLIGSQAFMEQDDVGLGDLSSDDLSVDSDRDSVIASEDDEDAVQSDEELDQEKECHGTIKKKPSVLSYEDDEDDEDSDIFGDSDKEDDDGEENGKPSKGPPSFADELAARIKGESTEGDRASLTSKKKSKDKKVAERPSAVVDDDSNDMFKPPKMEDEDFSPFGGRGGLFSGGKSLFDDDDDEGDLFSETPKAAAEDKPKSSANTTGKPGKKIPPGGVSILPDNSLFGSENYSDSVERKENGTSIKPKSQGDTKQTHAVGSRGAGGLFDEEDEDDYFFSEKSLMKSSSAGQDTSKPKNIPVLFGENNEDEEAGDIFRENRMAPTQIRNEVPEEQAKSPEKRVPAGAISVFGPGTKTLLTEGLRKRQPSTREESEKSENEPPLVIGNTSTNEHNNKSNKPQTSGLFSDDEDTQIFPTIPKSQSKPEYLSQAKINKIPTSLFDDEEEEDLFASATKSKPKSNQGKASTPQPKKTIASSLFSDDEDQWFNAKPSAGMETPSGGMKSSASAPSGLPSAVAAEKATLFHNDDEDDLFAPTKQLSQKKPQRVALLFEDESGDDVNEPPLFGFKPGSGSDSTAPSAKTSTVATPVSSLFDPEQPAEAAVSKATRHEREKPAVKSPAEELPSPLPENSHHKKKPVGAVSLFGGIDVLAKTQTTNPLDTEDDFLSKESPPPLVSKKKVKANTLSLFDDDEGEKNETDWNVPISITSKPVSSTTIKPAEEKPCTKSTGVFQDEELLFSQTQQKDNDPDVDLFATSGKPQPSTASTVRPAAPSLFAEDDEVDLFFSSIKSKAPPPKVLEKPSKTKDEAPLTFSSTEVTPESEKPASSPVKSKDPSSRIWKLKANPNLMINPSALLPGAAPHIPGAVSVLPSLTPDSSSGVSSSSHSPSPATTPVSTGVTFDTPAQVTTLQSTNKNRAKVSAQRRPQTRAARQRAAQRCVEDTEGNQEGDRPGAKPAWSGLDLPSPAQASQSMARPKLSNTAAAMPSPQPLLSEVSSIPSVLALPVSTMPGNKDSSKGKGNARALRPSVEEDLFGSDSLFGGSSEPQPTTPSSRHTTKTEQPMASSRAIAKSDRTLPSIFDDGGDDLFQKVKPRPATHKAKASFMEEKEDDNNNNDDDDGVDIFGVKDSSYHTSAVGKDNHTSSKVTKQEEKATMPKSQKKHTEKSLDASLFDDNVDIFADLTATSKPKEKSKKKVETRSIFDDDMDDIFSSTVKPSKRAPLKSKKVASSKDTTGAAADSGSIFDDPLNALGGN